MKDKTWTDAHEHDCLWFYQAKEDKPAVCNLKAAADNCAISCQSKQECFAHSEVYPTYFTWDRTRLIKPKHADGSVCLGIGLSKAKVVAECRAAYAKPNTLNLYAELLDEGDEAKMQAFLAANELEDSRAYLDLTAWYASSTLKGKQPRAGKRLNLTDCDDLEAAIDEHCGFDMEPVRNFTRDLKERGGDYTIAFWVKPVSMDSELTHNVDGPTGRFFPHIKFLSQITPPTHHVSLLYFVNPNGEFRFDSKCPSEKSRDIFWNIEVNKASNDGWTFFSASVQNVSRGSDGLVDGNTFTNTGVNSETADSFFTCLYDESAFFRAIEVNYPMLITPIMMIPKYLPIATLQTEYLR